jgi:hypothetical protein
MCRNRRQEFDGLSPFSTLLNSVLDSSNDHPKLLNPQPSCIQKHFLSQGCTMTIKNLKPINLNYACIARDLHSLRLLAVMLFTQLRLVLLVTLTVSWIHRTINLIRSFHSALNKNTHHNYSRHRT